MSSRKRPDMRPQAGLIDVDKTRIVHSYRSEPALHTSPYGGAGSHESVPQQPVSYPNTPPANNTVNKVHRTILVSKFGRKLSQYVVSIVAGLFCVLGAYAMYFETPASFEQQARLNKEIEPLVSRYQNLEDYFGGEEFLAFTANSLKEDIARGATTRVSQKGVELVKGNAPAVSFTSGLMERNTAVTDDIAIKRMMIRIITQKVYDVVKRYPAKMDPVEVTSKIMSESLKAGFDPLLTAAVIKIESAFNPKAVSRVGARGLMQIMPGTKKYIEKLEKIPKSERESLNVPEYNLRLGIAYLKYLIKKYNGNRGYALMAYNWGPGHLSRALKRSSKPKVPTSVHRYAVKILDSHSVWNSQMTTQLLFR